MMNSSPTKKLSMLLNSDLHYRAKLYALETDQTLTELITSLLVAHLEQSHQGSNRNI
jgi:hypothetical protein